MSLPTWRPSDADGILVHFRVASFAYSTSTKSQELLLVFCGCDCCCESSDGECPSRMSHSNLALSSDTLTTLCQTGASVLTTAPTGPTSASSVKTTPPSGPSTPSSCAPEMSPSPTTRRSWTWPTSVSFLWLEMKHKEDLQHACFTVVS